MSDGVAVIPEGLAEMRWAAGQTQKALDALRVADAEGHDLHCWRALALREAPPKLDKLIREKARNNAKRLTFGLCDSVCSMVSSVLELKFAK